MFPRAAEAAFFSTFFKSGWGCISKQRRSRRHYYISEMFKRRQNEVFLSCFGWRKASNHRFKNENRLVPSDVWCSRLPCWAAALTAATAFIPFDAPVFKLEVKNVFNEKTVSCVLNLHIFPIPALFKQADSCDILLFNVDLKLTLRSASPQKDSQIPVLVVHLNLKSVH